MSVNNDDVDCFFCNLVEWKWWPMPSRQCKMDANTSGDIFRLDGVGTSHVPYIIHILRDIQRHIGPKERESGSCWLVGDFGCCCRWNWQHFTTFLLWYVCAREKDREQYFATYEFDVVGHVWACLSFHWFNAVIWLLFLVFFHQFNSFRVATHNYNLLFTY